MMNRKFLFILPLVTILIAGCRRGGTSSISSSSTASISSSSQTSTTSSSKSSETSATTSSSHSSSSTSSSSSSSSTAPLPETISIKEANELGKTYASQVPSGEHEYFGESISTKGRAIQNIAIGINQDGLTYICDGEDMIPCLSGTSGNTLYAKCSDYINKETSNYIVTGYIGYYYSMPCLKVTSFELKQTMTFNIDFTTFEYQEFTTVESYNNFLLDVDYNKKGYGESKLVKFSNLKCLGKVDDNSWLMSDGYHAQNIYFQTSNTAFSTSSQYCVYGISCLYKWRPSLRVLGYELSKGETITLDIDAISISKTATQMYSSGCPTEDTEKSITTNNFVKTFKYFYKSDLYFNYYTSNSNGYVVAGDSYYSSEISSQATAKDRKMLLFNNDSYNRWQYTTYVPVANYLLENQILTSYYVEYQFTKNSGVMMPQVYMLEEYIPS